MHAVEGRLLLSPSDLVAYLACDHLAQLEMAEARGEISRPARVDPELDLLRRKGIAHESAQLDRLHADAGAAVEVADHGETLAGLRAAEAETLAAMRAGVPLIYQAAFFDGRWCGRADFLLRVDTPSDLGPWSYEVADAKLARSVRVDALLQMCEYSRQVERLQGRAPELMHVVLGTGEREAHRVSDHDAYFRAARARFAAFVDAGAYPTYPHPVDHCRVCAWAPECERRRRDDDHLSLVAGMRRDQTRRLEEAGITTVAGLAAAAPAPIAGMGEAPWERLRRQARLQVEERTGGTPVHEVLEDQPAGLGLGALPPPSPGDLFFDMEGDPYVEDGGLEYLFGLVDAAGGTARFHAMWALDRAAEKVAFEWLVDLVIERLERDPALHVYHYAQYEPAALKRLMGRHATREDEVDRLLRGGVFVDLYQVVRQGVRVSCESYGLKSLEVFYMPPRTEEIADAVSSIVAYERWRETGDRAELEAIAAYNERDCVSTMCLRDWLESLRDEWSAAHGRPPPRPEQRSAAPSDAVLVASEETRDLVRALTAGVPAEEAARTPEQRARRLLAYLLDWHRREDRAAWWEFFDRQARTDAELVEDREALGAVRHAGPVGASGQSTVHRYTFEPQEHRISAGMQVHDPRGGAPCGSVVDVDDDAGTVDLRRGPGLEGREHPTSLIPPGPPRSLAQRDALRRLARRVAAGRLREVGAAGDLLLADPPRVAGIHAGAALVAPGESAGAAAVRLAAALDRSYLPVQGPPGSGKTHTGALIVLDRVRRGRRVGVCATTHRAVGEVLTAVSRLAQESDIPVRILQRCGAEDRCGAPGVTWANDNGAVDTALADGAVDVVAGTPWLFAREEIEGALDLLLVDEAGQMSLANALAVAGAAGTLVLLGDPQQLAQPSRGVHPGGAAVSCLEHVLGGADTIAPDRGVFLATTQRMHPDICGFVSAAFYGGRLVAEPAAAARRVAGAGALSGAGLRLAPVPHSGNRTWSPEEVGAVRELVDALLGSEWSDEGGRRRLGAADVLVVAPYNVQVRRLREALPPGVRVGTVDKFQGQEAPVAVYSMATSSGEDVPRNLEFLFSRNRLNVAVSRAQALAVIVCSPLLLRAACRSPEQLRLVSAVCRFAELAEVVGVEAALTPA